MQLWRAMLGMAVIAAVVWPSPAHHAFAASGPAKPPEPPTMPGPTSQDRVLVLAPHPDDEVIGCGGYLAMAVRAGAQVRVVVVTSGEGFSLAAERLFGEGEVTPVRCLKLALERRSETLAALRHLGVRPDQAIFLAYPDRGLVALWTEEWYPAKPYVSPYTRVSSAPLPDPWGKRPAYCGASLLEELTRLAEEFKPTVVLCPHSSDLHGDHWAVYCYTVGALYQAGMLDRVALGTYLVHLGGWKRDENPNASEAMAPPPSLAGGSWPWRSLPLDRKSRQQKEAALREHASQMNIYPRYLLSFVKANELFGATSPAVRGAGSGSGPAGKPEAVSPTLSWSVSDAKGDITLASAPPGVDVVGLKAEADGTRLRVWLELAGESNREVSYRVDLHALCDRQVGPPISYCLKPGQRSGNLECELQGSQVAITIPWPPKAAEGVMLSASTWLGRRVADRTPWRMLLAR